MKGSITVAGNNNGSSIGENKNSKGNFDNMAVLMVPTQDINKHTNTLDKNDMNILSEYSFKDLRQTGGGGANQTLLILGSNDPINTITSVLKKITTSLPYS